eukprot:756749-Hanusia_phi.AAC.1
MRSRSEAGGRYHVPISTIYLECPPNLINIILRQAVVYSFLPRSFTQQCGGDGRSLAGGVRSRTGQDRREERKRRGEERKEERREEEKRREKRREERSEGEERRREEWRRIRQGGAECKGEERGEEIRRETRVSMSRMEDCEPAETSWTIETADSVHVGGKLLVRWSAPSSQCSARRDFLACYTFGSSTRKYIDYKQVEKEGMKEGKVEFAAPSKPGKYIFRYLRADYSEMAASPAVTVRSALSVLLEEVKSQGMRGNTEAVLEMFETMMLQLKANDEVFHKQALESWRELQARRSNFQDETAAPERLEAEEEINVPDIQAPTDSGLSAEETERSSFGQERMLRLRVRGSGYYSQGRDAQGDSRMVMLGESVMVEGDSAAAKSAAGLHLLVLRLSDLSVLFSHCYDTHHDGAAADRLSCDISSKALEVSEPSRVLVLVTSQYAWEGYFSSPVLCDRLARCGADLDRLLAIQRNCSSWISSRYSTPYVLVGIPGRRSELRFSAEILGGSQGKKQAAELELVLVKGAEEWLPVAVRSGNDKPWIWSLADPPGREPLPADSSSSSSSQASTVVAPGSLPALGHLALWALVTPASLKNDKLLSLLSPSHMSSMRAAMLSLGSEKHHLLKEMSFSAGQLRPMAVLVALHPRDLELSRAFTSILKVWIETPAFRSLLLEEALDVLIRIYSISESGALASCCSRPCPLAVYSPPLLPRAVSPPLNCLTSTAGDEDIQSPRAVDELNAGENIREEQERGGGEELSGPLKSGWMLLSCSAISSTTTNFHFAPKFLTCISLRLSFHSSLSPPLLFSPTPPGLAVSHSYHSRSPSPSCPDLCSSCSIHLDM